MSLFTKHHSICGYTPFVPPTPPIPIERRIEGYANYGKTVSIKINNEIVSIPRRSSDGFWRLDLEDDFVITSLSECFSASTTGYGIGDGVLTYIDLRFIGDLSQCESMFNLCTNQRCLNAITFPSVCDTHRVDSLRGAFNDCRSLSKLDLSMLDVSGIVGRGNFSMGTLLYMNEPGALISELKLPYLHKDIYLGGAPFNNCTNLANIEFNGIDSTQFFENELVLRLSHCTLSPSTIACLLSEKGICHSSTYDGPRMIEVNLETFNYIMDHYSPVWYRSYNWDFLVVA